MCKSWRLHALQLTQKKTALQFKALDQTLQTHDQNGVKQALSYRCADIDRIVPGLMGVSKVIASYHGLACHVIMPGTAAAVLNSTVVHWYSAGHTQFCERVSPRTFQAGPGIARWRHWECACDATLGLDMKLGYATCRRFWRM